MDVSLVNCMLSLAFISMSAVIVNCETANAVAPSDSPTKPVGATGLTELREALPVKFCTFFNNRAPTPQPDVKNCTWYKNESCCTQIEIEETFRNMKPLQGSTKMCQRYINYLMCYICSPAQHIFYMYQRLRVCEDFCDHILQHCKGAILKGTRIGKLYSNGTQFCESRNLAVAKEKCFRFDDSDDDTLENAGYMLGIQRFVVLFIIVAGLVSV